MAFPSTIESVNVPLHLEALWPRGATCPFDDVIDVRSPGEFAEDHIPGAINLPVLNDAERAEVGTIYKRDGAFTARKVGAAYVSSNLATHLNDHFAGKGKEYRPLVYCWRGGQRSGSLATVLAQIGWRVAVLRGGYKTYRSHVRRELDKVPTLFTYRIVAGATGTGKTRILRAFAAEGAQVLDLEGLAQHRGSLLGGGGSQPSQKFFESQLLAAYDRFEPAAPVWIEAESNRIGDVYVPPALWVKMQSADGIEIQMPIEERVRHLLEDYAKLLTDPETLKEKLRQLTTRHGTRQIEAWCSQIDAREWGELVASLLTVHYDPAYRASAKRCFPLVTRTVELAAVTVEAVEKLAERLGASF